jgi:hypothetical protein
LESVVNESRKLEVANHEAVRLVAAQLDRAKRIVIVQQAILSAISRSNISDLDISIATAQQLVDPDRDWLIDANRSRCSLPPHCYYCNRFKVIFPVVLLTTWTGGGWRCKRAFAQRLKAGS